MSASEYVSHLFSYERQVVVVIGGTGVLGGAICDGFGKAGGHVVVSGRSEERGLARVEAIRQAGDRPSLSLWMYLKESRYSHCEIKS